MFSISRSLKLMLALALLTATSSFAGIIIIGQETNTGGFVGNVIPGCPGCMLAASDGESGFNPFGSTFDASDGMQWNQNPFTFTLQPGSNWVQTGPQTWILPAINENEPNSETLGIWFIDQPVQWVPQALGLYGILSEEGAISDLILLDDNGPGGTARIVFSSDPLAGVPEPGTVALLGLGLLGLGYRKFSRKQA